MNYADKMERESRLMSNLADWINDPSWLIPIEEGGGVDGDAETEEVQADTVHGEGQPVR